MYKKKHLLVILLMLSSILNATTMFTLAGIKKVYPVVEISSSLIPSEYKKLIYSELKSTTKELQIDTTGFDSTSLAVLINEIHIGKSTLVNLRLLIGENVHRNSSQEKIFAITYDDKEHFIFRDGDDIEDKFEDALEALLTDFSDQYKEENRPLAKVEIKKDGFSSQMNYETNYQKAVKKAKKAHKNIMLVLVANYCPWCRKFEERVLSNVTTNDTIHSKYVPLILNKEKDDFPKELNNSFTPVINFIDYQTLKSYKTVIGYNNKDEFLYFVKSDSKH